MMIARSTRQKVRNKEWHYKIKQKFQSCVRRFMERAGIGVHGVMRNMSIMTQYLREGLKKLMKTGCISIRSVDIMCGTSNKAESEG